MATTEKVMDILKQLSGVETISPTESLQNDLALDSLSMVALLIQIEDVFGIELDAADMDPFALDTVESVVRLVEKYAGTKDE